MNNDVLKKVSQLTPLYKLYFEIQLEHPDKIICLQCGDFYEIWGIDEIQLGYAKKAHKIADLKLTKKVPENPESPDMCGFPVRTAEAYFKRLVDSGESVVVITQKTNGTKADKNKSIERYIEKILSAGTIVENISEEKSNYYACVFEQYGVVGVSLLDLSTGDVKVTEITLEELEDYLLTVNPAEILTCGNIELSEKKFKLVHKKAKINIKTISDCGLILSHIYGIDSPTSNPEYYVDVLGLDKWRFATLSLSNLVDHLSSSEYNKILLQKMSKPIVYNKSQHLNIPLNGLRSLEIFESLTGNYSDTLIFSLDKCKTAMGRRKLREWLKEPLIDEEQINQRLDKVQKYISKGTNYPKLDDVYDIPRLVRKLFLKKISPLDFKNLYCSLVEIKNIALEEGCSDLCERISDFIEAVDSEIIISEILLQTEKDFLFFKKEKYPRLDAQIKKIAEKKEIMLSLKEKYEKIINDGNPSAKELRLEETKDSYKLKGAKSIGKFDASLKMKKLESSIEIREDEFIECADSCFGEEQKYFFMASHIWEEFCKEISDRFYHVFADSSEFISRIDVLLSFARISKERFYSRPTFIDSDRSYFEFKSVRHPVVELNESLQEEYVPTDVSLNSENDIMCIYGANSSGKTTLLKAVAQNIIMAQIGCFVPCSSVRLTSFQSILVRMTTFDSLSEGLSTFTMEMKELKTALNYKKEKSLFLLDEIGRGTSVEDGEAIAFATLEHLSSGDRNCLVFFATHYHALAEKIEPLKNICIKNMDCFIDSHGNISFSRELKDGAGTGSYGIDVAFTCGLPESLIRVARNYSKRYFSLKSSRYNKSVKGIICPICETNPVQETHHIVDQKQGTVEEIIINGIKKYINHKDNLIMICGSCHNKITLGEIELKRKKDLK